MKIIKYQIITKVNYGTEDEPQITEIFASKMIECSEETYESNLAIAQAEAYNGEYTVEDIEDPEHVPTTDERVASLEEENALLKAQVDMQSAQINAQSEQMDFYEDCIAEMASVVYA